MSRSWLGSSAEYFDYAGRPLTITPTFFTTGVVTIVRVFVNGILVNEGQDYDVSTSGLTVSFRPEAGVDLSDEVAISYEIRSVLDTLAEI